MALISALTVSPFFNFRAFTEAVVMTATSGPAAVASTTSDMTLSLTMRWIVPSMELRMLCMEKGSFYGCVLSKNKFYACDREDAGQQPFDNQGRIAVRAQIRAGKSSRHGGPQERPRQ